MHNRFNFTAILFIMFILGTAFPSVLLAQDEQLMITAIEIRGNVVVTDQEILSVMTGRAGSTFSLNTLSSDLDAIEDLGWFATVPEHILEPFEGGVKIIIEVIENPEFVGISITQHGPGVFPSGELAILFDLPVGTVINNNDVTNGINRIERKYRDDGYTAATITDIQVGDDGIIAIEINEGVIHEIIVEGNTKTRTYVIMREINIQVGDVFNAITFRRDLERIYNLQLFEDIQPSIELDSASREVILKITVTEARTGQLGFGAGYSSSDGLLGTLSYSETNFRGTAQRLTAMGQIGGPNPDFQLSWFSPYIDKQHTSISIEGFMLNESSRLRDPVDPDILTAFELERIGGSIGVVRPTSEFVTVSLTLRFLNGDVTFIDEDGKPLAPEDIPELDDNEWVKNGLIDGSINSFTGRVAYDTRDFTLDPTQGQVASAQVSMIGHLIGGDYDAFKYETEYRYFLPLTSPPEDVSSLSPNRSRQNHVLAFRVLYGASTGDLPLIERFEIGGQQSVRGTEETAQSGNTAFLFNTEYRFPLGGNLGGAIFFDAGTAALPGSSLDFTNMISSVGIGVRYRISFFGIAPIRLDYGYDLENNEGRIVFGFGQLF